MAKSLELQVTLKGNQAETALKALVGSMKQADTEQKNLKKSGEGVENQMKQTAVATNSATAATGKFSAASSALGSVAGKAFGGVRSAINSVGSSLLQYVKYAGLAAVATGGIIATKAFSNLVDFSSAFGNMNAVLRAKQPATLKQMEQELVALSNQTGKTAVQMANLRLSMLSSGFGPTAKEGTKEYTEQLKTLNDVQERLVKSAVGNNQDIEEYAGAYTKVASSLDMAVNSMETANYVNNLLSASYDAGSGNMDEYAAQFAKFTRLGKQAGASIEETTALFTGFTRVMDVNMAGFTTKGIMEWFNELPTAARQAESQVRLALKDKTTTTAERKILTKYDSREEWNQVFYKHDEKGNFTLDKQGMKIKKDVQSLVASVKEIYKTLPDGSPLKDVMIKALAANDVAAKGWKEMLSDKNYEKIFGANGTYAQVMEGTSKDSKLAMEKFLEVQKSFGFKWTRFQENFNNRMMTTMGALSPAMGVMMDLFSGMLGGGAASAEAISKGFADARKNLIDSKQEGLLPFVDGMETLTKWFQSGDAEKFFNGVTTSATKALGVIKTMTAGLVWAYDALNWVGETAGGIAASAVLGDGENSRKAASFLGVEEPLALAKKNGRGKDKYDIAASDGILGQWMEKYVFNRDGGLNKPTTSEKQIVIPPAPPAPVNVNVYLPDGALVHSTTSVGGGLNLGPGGSQSNPLKQALNPLGNTSALAQ